MYIFLYSRLYYKTFQKEYGEPKGEQLVKRLQTKLEEYNNTTGCRSGGLRQVGEKDLAVAIVAPLMRRVHVLIKHSGELSFIEASGNMGRHGCRVFLILTHSCAGDLPLGVLITTSGSTDTIKSAATLRPHWKSQCGRRSKNITKVDFPRLLKILCDKV